jgi:hypothetical protein
MLSPLPHPPRTAPFFPATSPVPESRAASKQAAFFEIDRNRQN